MRNTPCKRLWPLALALCVLLHAAPVSFAAGSLTPSGEAGVPLRALIPGGDTGETTDPGGSAQNSGASLNPNENASPGIGAGDGNSLNPNETVGENTLAPVGALPASVEETPVHVEVEKDAYDLALTTTILAAYDESGRPLAQSLGERPVPVVAGVRLQIRFRVESQGLPAKKVSIAAYVPEGFSVPEDANASGWQKGDTLPANPAEGIWSQLTIYRYTFPENALSVATAADAMLYVEVNGAVGEAKPGDYKAGIWHAADYYIAGEVTLLQDENGKFAKDIDSTPDSNPANDLFDNRDGTNKLYPITLYQKILDGTYLDEAKEFPGRRDGRAGLITSTLQDEDDFDFDYAYAKRTDIPQPEYGHILKLNRLNGEGAGLEALQGLFGVNAATYITAKTYMGLSPLQEGGILQSPNTYMLYELWVNRDGLVHTGGSTLAFTLPEGLFFPPMRSDNGNYDLAHIFQYEPVRRIPSALDASRSIISYQDGLVTRHGLEFQGDGNTGLRTLPLSGGRSAGAAGITATISANRRTLHVNFFSSAGDGAEAYQILALVAVDADNLRLTPLKPAAEYSYMGGAVESAEHSPLQWVSEGEKSLLALLGWDSQSDAFVQSPVFSVGLPDKDGLLRVRYRLLFRSAFPLETGMLQVKAALPAKAHAIENITCVAYASMPEDAASMEPAAATLPDCPLEAAPAADGRSLNITNARITRPGEFYTLTFDVAYENTLYGAVLAATLEDTQAVVVTTFSLSIEAAGGGRRREYALYYADESGQADTSLPVKTIKGQPIILSAGKEASFLPMGYAPGFAKSWNMVFVPVEEGSGAAGSFPFTLKTGKDGRLSISPAQDSGCEVITEKNNAATLLPPPPGKENENASLPADASPADVFPVDVSIEGTMAYGDVDAHAGQYTAPESNVFAVLRLALFMLLFLLQILLLVSLCMKSPFWVMWKPSASISRTEAAKRSFKS